MKPETEGKIKYGVWGIVFGAIIAMIIGFGWGGWTTAGTTKKVSAKAVLESQTAICVAQFTMQPNYDEKLKEFEKVIFYERPKFIENGGWDKMPGQEKADFDVSRACSDGITLIAAK